METQAAFHRLREHLEQVIVGQSSLLDRLMIALLTGGHVLLEGPPGLAKTTAVNTLANGIHASFQRIQFTPDLMPGDLTGSDIYDPKEGRFHFMEGPLFHEIILADEINRAPPKVQSALLEAMQEHQVSIGNHTRPLPELFIVLATQNPLEQSGTYPLPEAQLDRFLLHVVLDYPSQEEELLVLQRDREHHQSNGKSDIPKNNNNEQSSTLQTNIVMEARREMANIYIDEMLERYIVSLVAATRNLASIEPSWKDHLIAGASPRASIALLRSATAIAYLHSREFVTPEDIIEIAADVLRHRIILSYAARADNVTADMIIKKILATVPVP